MSETLVANPESGPVEPQLSVRRASGRLLSLDVFRGLTMAGMIMVNNAGDWSHKYAPLGHANWHGWTPTDLVFPSFLFIVGVAMAFSFDRRLAEGFGRLRLLEHVVRRTLILFCLGLIIFSFPVWRLMGPYILAIAGLVLVFWDGLPLAWPGTSTARRRKMIAWALLGVAVIWWVIDFQYFQSPHPPATLKTAPLRIPGVLQRIAVCYLLASIVMMLVGVRGRVVVTAAILLGYWWMVNHLWPVSAPDGYPLAARPEGILHAWLDAKLLGRHVYSELPDPEGIVSTLGGLATCLLGVLTGTWLRARRSDADKLIGLFFAANLMIVAGLWMDYSVPINKKIWTSSYVLLAGGIAMHMLAMCYWLVDVKGYRRWSLPFVVFGTNAILVYFASGIVGRMLAFYTFGVDAPSLRTWIFQQGFASHFPASGYGPYNASLAFALAYVLFWLIVLIPLYRRRIFLKV
jgi:predicted acyltransferase